MKDGKMEFVVLRIYLSTNELGYDHFLRKIQSKHPQSKHLQRSKLKFLHSLLQYLIILH